jgi:hypothetical protein
MSINIAKFNRQFEKEYNFLYDNHDNVAGYQEAVTAFDNFLKTHNNFVCEFARYRNDIISSDSEAAAFMFALETMS